MRKYWKPLVGGLLFFLSHLEWLLDQIGRVQVLSDLPVLKWILSPYFSPIAFAAATIFVGWGYYDLRIHKEHAGFIHSPERRKRLSRNIIVALVAVILVFVIVPLAYNRIRSRSSRPPATASIPDAPTMTQVTAISDVAVNEAEIPIAVSQSTTPCTIPGKSYSYSELHKMPGGANATRPWLLPKPQRFIVRVYSIGPSKDLADLLVEVEVVSRGLASVAKEWKLCLVHDNKPLWFKAEEITDDNRSVLNSKPSLADISLNPIEHGHIAVGWLLFRVPVNIVQAPSEGLSLECRDYLEHRASVSFGSSPKKSKRLPSKPKTNSVAPLATKPASPSSSANDPCQGKGWAAIRGEGPNSGMEDVTIEHLHIANAPPCSSGINVNTIKKTKIGTFEMDNQKQDQTKPPQ